MALEAVVGAWFHDTHDKDVIGPRLMAVVCNPDFLPPHFKLWKRIHECGYTALAR
jgi:hypothetical protein